MPYPATTANVFISPPPRPRPAIPNQAPLKTALPLLTAPHAQTVPPRFHFIRLHTYRSTSHVAPTCSGFATSTSGQVGVARSSDSDRPTTQHCRMPTFHVRDSHPHFCLDIPRTPSVSYSSTDHMRDPCQPPPIRPTSWSLQFGSEDEEAPPLHAWCSCCGRWVVS